MIKKIFIAAIAMIITMAAQAQEDKWQKWGPTRQDGVGVIARAGYTIGGTSPIPLPAEIRSINGFSPQGGATIGADVYKMFSKRWGLSVAWRLFYEGFNTNADVKNYKMSITMDGNTMSGYFTGTNETTTDMWGMTIPVLATVRVSPRWNISVGPYFSTYFKKRFDGKVYDNKDGVGYLRVDTPTGQKVIIDRTKAATYPDDFADHMRSWNGGLEFAFDYKATRHMNVFASLDWGMSNIFEPEYEAIAFKMFPIYATIGLAYRY